MIRIRRGIIFIISTLLVAALSVVTVQAASAQMYSSGVFSVSYSGDLYEVDAGRGSVEKLSYSRWVAMGSPTPRPAATDFVKYSWSPTIYAVTFFGNQRHEWVWNQVTFGEWSRAGFPTARSAGWIQGTYFYKWGTSDELFAIAPDHSYRKLSGNEWAAAGFPSPDNRSNEGFIKYSWNSTIVRMTDLAAGQGYAINYAQWQAEAFPTPRVVTRVAGDQVYQNYGSADIWYAGPGVNVKLSAAQWRSMGSPAPTVKGAPTGGGGATTPSRPTKDLDCKDFSSAAAAQREFDRLYPYYGDIYGLDRDGDGRVCESRG